MKHKSQQVRVIDGRDKRSIPSPIQRSRTQPRDPKQVERDARRVNAYFKGMANYHPLIPHVAGEYRFAWQAKWAAPSIGDPNNL